MRDILRFFNQTYSAVRTNERIERRGVQHDWAEAGHLNPYETTTVIDQSQAQSQEQYGSSLKSGRSMNSGFSILDVFFNQPKRGRGPRWPKGIFLLKASGLLAIIAAITMYLLQPYTAIFKWKLIFADNGEIFNLWQNPPVEVYIKIYLYNITNAEAFMAGDEPKMRVEQVGPYVYREKLLHDEIVFNPNGTLSAVPKHPLVWNAEMSMGHKEDDLLMLPNIALLSIAQVAADKNFFVKMAANLLIRRYRSQPIVQMTAREFMFGYETELTTMGNTLTPDWITFSKVGLIDRMYDFEGDFETVFTGELDSSVAGLLDTYRGSSHLHQWKEPHCSDIKYASDGTKYKSFISEDETLLFFRKSMCRPQRMVRTDNITRTVGTLSAYKYQFENNSLDNGFYDERNKCFCRNGNCLPVGLLDVSDCYYGFPIALSYPHFLDSDEKLRTDVLGSEPDRIKHETYFMIQPMSGLPLQLSVKMQINMAMRDVSMMANVERFADIVLPMLWFEISMVDLPEPLKNRFHLYLNILPVVDKIGQVLLLLSGILLFLVAIVRASLSFSQSVQQTTRNISSSHQSKYVNIERRVDFELGEDEDEAIIAYEMSEKRIRSDESLYEVDLCGEQEFMLEREEAISEDDDDRDDDGSRTYSSNQSDDNESDTVPQLINQNVSYEQSLIYSTAPIGHTQPVLGVFSSSLDEIGTDDFPELHIVEDRDDVAVDDDDDDDDDDVDAAPNSISIILEI